MNTADTGPPLAPRLIDARESSLRLVVAVGPHPLASRTISASTFGISFGSATPLLQTPCTHRCGKTNKQKPQYEE